MGYEAVRCASASWLWIARQGVGDDPVELRIAQAIAYRRRAQALVTGDVVGQVASQTLENIGVINDVAVAPLRAIALAATERSA